MYVCVCVCVCVYVCMYICKYMCVCVRAHAFHHLKLTHILHSGVICMVSFNLTHRPFELSNIFIPGVHVYVCLGVYVCMSGCMCVCR